MGRKPSPILERSDMEVTRSPAQLLACVMRKCAELGASPDAKAFARSGALLPKKFYDEIYPLATYAEREFRGQDGVLVQPNLDWSVLTAARRSVVSSNFRSRSAPQVRREVSRGQDNT